MRVVKNTYYDIYFNNTIADRKRMRRKEKELFLRGFTLESKDSGSAPYDFCYQYIMTTILKQKEETK